MAQKTHNAQKVERQVKQQTSFTPQINAKSRELDRNASMSRSQISGNSGNRKESQLERAD